MMYIASPTIVQTTRTGTITRQVPTFLLDGNIQGIVDEKHASRIVMDVCNPTKDKDIIVNPNVFRTL